MQLQRRTTFRGCSHSFMFGLPYLLDSLVAPTVPISWKAAKPFTPRNEHAVTHHGLWYRYVPETGKLARRDFHPLDYALVGRYL